ncbi:hypothetical protein KIN20_001903 [Parelaphostrongylus tenuis]|uniref:Uncharacterized protein n=1 Tax=Parelaphostrongylus tenuis TaxID=148309 RepID=A0AAD5LZ23_PARTN|nr:hypothetical protein KIN20_001903 [Parelaphostrongylus tenuis]
MNTTNNPFVSYHLSSRSICGWKLDTLPSTSRFDALQSVDCDEDLSLPYALASALKSWADSWPRYEVSNSSCEDLPLPSRFAPRYFINSFVHTRSQIEAYFPSCSKSYMKDITTKFNAERAIKDKSTELLQFSIRNDVIIAYRSITDQYDNRLAVVGVQWRMPYLNALFMNWTRSTKQWSDCRKMDCLLITRSGFVLASSTSRSPAPLAQFDPQLFASLEENGLVATSSWVDAQAECMASRSAPWSSPAAYRANPLQAIINSIATMIGKTLWIDLYYLMTSFVTGQPSMSGGLCRFQRIKPVERCFIRLTSYKMTLNISKQIQLSDITCARYARVFPVPHTTLTMIRVDRACPAYRAKRKYPLQSQILEGCEKVAHYEKTITKFVQHKQLMWMRIQP